MNKPVSRPDYTCMEEVTTGVVVIDSLPAGFGQKPQKLPEPIEIIKTKVVDVGDTLQKKEVLPTRMLSKAEVEKMLASGQFTLAMVPARKCRSCENDLTADRHWNCRKCVPQLPEESGEFLYSGVSGE